jgi:hypothetical protein
MYVETLDNFQHPIYQFPKAEFRHNSFQFFIYLHADLKQPKSQLQSKHRFKKKWQNEEKKHASKQTKTR